MVDVSLLMLYLTGSGYQKRCLLDLHLYFNMMLCIVGLEVCYVGFYVPIIVVNGFVETKTKM